MRNNKITTTYVPVNPSDLKNKAYVDSLSTAAKRTKNNVGYIPILFIILITFSLIDMNGRPTEKLKTFGLKLNVPLQLLLAISFAR